MAKLTAKDKDFIRQQVSERGLPKALAKKFKVTVATIYNVRRGVPKYVPVATEVLEQEILRDKEELARLQEIKQKIASLKGRIVRKERILSELKSEEKGEKK